MKHLIIQELPNITDSDEQLKSINDNPTIITIP